MSSKDLQPAETSPLGFSPDQAFAAAAGPRKGSLAWKKGGSTTVEFQLTPVSLFRYVDQVFVAGNDAMYLECSDDLRADATMTLKTADGAFDESWPVVIHALQVGQVEVWLRVDPSTVKGSYTVTEVDMSKYSRADLNLSLTFHGAGWYGTIRGGAERRLSGAVEYQFFDVAEFWEGANPEAGVWDAEVPDAPGE